VEALDPLDEAAGALSAGAVGLVEAGAGGLGDPGDRDGEGLWLVGRVRGPGVVDSLLAGVRAVDSLPEAGTLRGALATHESVVTRDGLWRGPGWLWVDRTAGADDGVLARERAVRVLVAEREQLAAAVSALVSEQAAGHRLLAELEGRQTTLQSELTVLQRERAAAQTRLGERRGQLEHLRRRAGELDRELAELAGQMESMGADLARAGERLAGARTELQGLEAEREALLAERGPSRARLEEARRQANAARQRAQGLALALEGLRAQRDGLARTAERASHHLEEMEARRGDLAGMVAAARAPLPGLEAAREEALGRQVRVEAELRAARERGEEMEAAVRSLDHRRREAETAAEAERCRCEAARLAQEASRVRLQEVQQAVQQYGTALPRVLESLPEDAIETEWQSRLEGVERRLARLGAINLAAIDEHTQLSERKRYLDAQHEDLVEALGTLEAAIRRMDRETRARFRETYDRVNDSFRGTFPRLLGGGEASLELAGDDLLESGVTVMARPPGKRNTSIHLLSGGEKALTAVALVFAIFQLNPAPFCLLDEVDAPLDDANVGRFCDLVRSMSEQVQFLIVTHNKTTMELADRLVGVTMHEAGVSRLVHVDVDSALEMAAG
jgi:chromosome segregation protein